MYVCIHICMYACMYVCMYVVDGCRNVTPKRGVILCNVMYVLLSVDPHSRQRGDNLVGSAAAEARCVRHVHRRSHSHVHTYTRTHIHAHKYAYTFASVYVLCMGTCT